MQVKQGGSGVKTAFKDIKSKLSDRTQSKVVTRLPSTASATTGGYQHHSAPNSPVFTKRPQSDLISISNNSSSHRCKSQKMLQTSNSLMNNSNLTNHFNNNLSINNNSSNTSIDLDLVNSAAVATSATASYTGNINLKSNSKTNSHTNITSPMISSSPTSSLSSSSEMNILQELQQHALFKLPTVDRSVSSFTFTQQQTKTSIFSFNFFSFSFKHYLT